MPLANTSNTLNFISPSIKVIRLPSISIGIGEVILFKVESLPINPKTIKLGYGLFFSSINAETNKGSIILYKEKPQLIRIESNINVIGNLFFRVPISSPTIKIRLTQVI
jgi:hypothetical protein